jgi:hypothetical protein
MRSLFVVLLAGCVGGAGPASVTGASQAQRQVTTANVTVCRGTNPTEDAALAASCTIVCPSTLSDCTSALQQSIGSDRTVTWSAGDYPLLDDTHAGRPGFVVIEGVKNLTLNAYGARLLIAFNAPPPNGWEGGIFAVDDTSTGANTNDVSINGVEVVGNMQCPGSVSGGGGGGVFCMGILSMGLTHFHVQDAKVSGVFGFQYFIAGGHSSSGTVGDLSVINSWGSAHGTNDIIGGGDSDYMLLQGNTLVHTLDVGQYYNAIDIVCARHSRIVNNDLHGNLVIGSECNPSTDDVIDSNSVAPAVGQPGPAGIFLSIPEIYDVSITNNTVWPNGGQLGVIGVVRPGADIVVANNHFPGAAPSTSNPIGHLDAVTNGVAQGWALDPDSPATGIDVHFYVDVDGAGGFAGITTANLARPDVNAATGFPGDHGFSFALPARYRDGQPHTVFVHGIDVTGGANVQLAGSPMQFTVGAAQMNPPQNNPPPTATTHPLFRFYNEDTATRLTQTSNTAPAGWTFEGGVCDAFDAASGAHAIYGCVRPGTADHFTSTDSGCEGQASAEGMLGYLQDAPSASAGRTITRCTNGAAHLDTGAPDVECTTQTGYRVEAAIGYAP